MEIETDSIWDSKPEPLLAAGEMLGSCRIVSLIGKGGMGEVYLARNERLQRPVAIKRTRPDRAFDDLQQERFRREALAVAQLSHPAIVQVFEWLDTPCGNCLVMERIHGRSLMEVIAARELTLPRTLQIGCEIAEGLAEAHGKGFIHRDLKPENVLVTTTGHAKIVDFGIASKSVDTGPRPIPRSHAPGAVASTYHVMSPEQAEGLELDHRSDLFSFGCILYEMLTGRSPFLAATWMATLRKVLCADPEPLLELRPDLPPPLVALVESLLAKDREERPANAAAVCLGLEAIPLGASGTAANPPAPAFSQFHFPTLAGPERDENGARVETATGTLLRIVPIVENHSSSGWKDPSYFATMARSLAACASWSFAMAVSRSKREKPSSPSSSDRKTPSPVPSTTA